MAKVYYKKKTISLPLPDYAQLEPVNSAWNEGQIRGHKCNVYEVTCPSEHADFVNAIFENDENVIIYDELT